MQGCSIADSVALCATLLPIRHNRGLNPNPEVERSFMNNLSRGSSRMFADLRGSKEQTIQIRADPRFEFFDEYAPDLCGFSD
jgi:hypothetical protein